MTKRILLILPAVLLLTGAGLVWSLASVSPGSATQVHANGEPTKEPAVPVLPPRAVVEITEHDFGVMDPFKRRRHTFAIRNEGAGALKLKMAGSTCKCTVGKLAQDSIPPGGEGKVVLEWRTKRQAAEFSHAATILTNDPARKRIRFFVRGRIRIHLGADPPELVFSGIRPGKTATMKTLLSSEVWPEFEVLDVEATLPGLTWTIGPAPQDLLDAVGSLSGFELTVHLPGDLPAGVFNHLLKLTVAPVGRPEESKSYDLPVAGHVLRRLSIYGDAIDSSGTIRFGSLPPGQGAKRSLLVKVYDDEPDLLVQRIETEPAYLEAKLETQRVERGRPGLYRMTVTVPTDAPVGSHLHARHGEIRILSGHPRISQTRLRVEFVVTAQPRRKASR